MRAAWLAVGLGWFAAALGAGPAAAIETAKVDAAGGVPRIVIDGKPVRSRIFWGGRTGGRLPIGPQGSKVDFEFSPVLDAAGNATLHFRFGVKPGDVYLSDLRVTEVETGREVVPNDASFKDMKAFGQRFHVWPQGEANTVGKIDVAPQGGRDGGPALHVTVKKPEDSSRQPDFHFYHQANLTLRKGQRYRVELWAKAEPARDLSIAFYRPGSPFIYLGGPPGPFESQVKLAAAVGVDMVSFPVGMSWPKPGEAYDWRSADEACSYVLSLNPKALLLPRIGVDPPAWWFERHPDARMVWNQGKHPIDAVVASPEFLRDASKHLAALVEHLEAKFGSSIIGYHPCGQNTGEWFYQDTWLPPLNGYAKDDQRAWRAWLTRRYKTDAALQAAWKNPAATLAAAEVPAPTDRSAAPAGVLRDPVKERAILDFGRFQQEAMAECVCRLAKAVREGSRGRKLVVFFYGYVFEFGAIGNGPAISGHYDLRRVLQSPDVDVLCAPTSYFDRGLGQNAPSMTAAESVALAGKMWLTEDDTRTYLAVDEIAGSYSPVDTLEKTNYELLRNTGQCALRHFGTWWMDLGMTGWFNDARMWAEMERLRPLDEAMLARPRPFRPEAAVVIDEENMLYPAAGGTILTRPGIYEVRRPLGRMGAPYGQYLLDDVTAGRVEAKMYVLLNAWRLSAQQRERLLETTRDALKIWCYAPGYYDEDRPSSEAMKQLTGFSMKRVSKTAAWAEPTAQGRKLGLTAGFGMKAEMRPLLAAADAKPNEVWATYPDGSAAVALRRTARGPSLFVGVPGLSSEVLRAAAKQAGVHLYTEGDCNVYANGPYAVLHASQDGPVVFKGGEKGRVRDFLTGKLLSETPQTTLPMRLGETRILVTE